MNEQQFAPLVPPERVQLFAEDESLICLGQPPFHTIADEMRHAGSEGFWECFGAIHQIDPERALIIGDFGMGSDSPIVLEFSRGEVDPPVLRLRWGPKGVGNEWVQGADNFESFARLLGLVAWWRRFPKVESRRPIAPSLLDLPDSRFPSGAWVRLVARPEKLRRVSSVEWHRHRQQYVYVIETSAPENFRPYWFGDQLAPG